MNWALARRIYEERRGLILPLALALVANILVLLLVVLPMQAGLAAAEAAEREAVVDLSNARLVNEQANEAAASRESADGQLQAFYGQVLPPDSATARKTTNLWLQQAALDAGLTFDRQDFATEPVEDSRLTRARAQIVLAGRYTDIRRFLYAVERAEEFIIVERVELAQSGSVDGNDRLGVVVNVSTYFPTPAS